ncbi:MAG: type I 3-dehydroquinate dehydratase [Pyrobaculum sp.]
MPARAVRDVEKAIEAPTPCVELRLDYAERVEDLTPALRKAVERKVAIFTIRHISEGGRWTGGEEERAQLYERLLELNPHYVDIEAASPLARRLRPRGGTKIIASRHDLEGTPTLDVLIKWAREAAEVGDVVKIVTYAHTPQDGLRVLSLIGAVEKPVVAFAMGPAGVYTRVASVALGSPIAYVSLGEATAPGQLSLDAFYAALVSIGEMQGERGLPALREALDWTDGAIMYILKRRLEICRDLGRLKKAQGLPIYDDVREMQVLRRAGDFRQIFELVVQMCKAVQLVV